MTSKLNLTNPSSKFMILIVLLLVFSAGFLVARARYKPQIRTSFDMVMEREELINDLKTRITTYEDKIRMEMQQAQTQQKKK